MFTTSERLASQVLSDVFNFLSNIQKLLCSPSEHKVSLIITPKLEQGVTMRLHWCLEALELERGGGSSGTEGESLVEPS